MNPYANSASTYKNQQVHTATREQILIMLYEGAIRFLNQAKVGHAENNIEKYHNNLIKTQRIIVELMTTLDMEIGGEMARNLYKLYEYFHYRLVQANLKKDVTMIDEVQQHLRDLKSTWEKAIIIYQKEQSQQDTDNSDLIMEGPRAYSA